MDVKFKDFSVEVKSTLETLAQTVLEEVGGELESAVKRNTAVDTGQTKNSWTHTVRKTNDIHTVTVGSPLQNAIWEEFGTGEYALNGNGRKGGWYYEDRNGNGHFTYGKHPRRPLFKAYTTMKKRIIKRIQNVFKGGLKR